MEKEKFIQDSVGETLLITLYMKYRESQKENPIIKDKLATKLVSEINYDFSKFKKGNNSSIGVAIRTKYFDELTKTFILCHENPVIVVVGCGLDTRLHRIGHIANNVPFYQLDIPEVMEIREHLIPKTKEEEYIHSSMLETKWMNELQEKHKDANFLFIIEGIFMYFKKEQVQQVLQNIAIRFPNSELIFDIINSWMSKKSHIHDTVKHTNATFKFGTDDDKEIEKWATNLELISSKLFTDFPEWKRAGWKGRVLKIIPTLRKSGRMLHYQIN